MAYELKITADNFAAFKAHIIALEEMFTLEDTAPVADPVMPEVKKAAAKGTTKAEPAKVEASKEETKAAEPEVSKEEPKAEVVEAKTLDFQEDVLPLVFKLTEAKGRDAVIAVLETFSVAKASQVAPERFGEFVDALNAAIG